MRKLKVRVIMPKKARFPWKQWESPINKEVFLAQRFPPKLYTH